jgi:hypothetical protein
MNVGTSGAAPVAQQPAAGAWTAILDTVPRVLPTQTPEWLSCVCAVDGYADATRYYEGVDGGRLVLPLVRRSVLGSALAWSASLPTGWGPAGLVGEDGVVRPEDVRRVAADLSSGPSLGVALRPDPAATAAWEAGMPAWVRRDWHTAQSVPLDGGFARVWRDRFRGDARNRVRRAERAGVVVDRDDTGRLVPLFHRLYALSVDRWARKDGLPPALARWRARRREPDRKLATVAARLGPDCRLYAAFVAGRPAAAIVVLLGRGTAAYWRGAMDEKLAGPTYANYLLHRTAIEDAAVAGRAVYHMGDSAAGSPLALFKSRFGAVERRYARYRIESVPIGAWTAEARAGLRHRLHRGSGRC